MARWNRGLRHPGLRCHSDAGSQFTSIRYGERLAEIGATPSIGTVGDSYDNALAETVNGYYKAELIRGPARTGPWKTIEEVELATLGWVHWHNTQRLHGYLGYIPPVEFEALHAVEHASEALDPGDLTIAQTASRAADRLPARQTEPCDGQIASNAAPEAATASTVPRSWPSTPAGTVTIMCGSPGFGINRTPRGHSRITDGASGSPSHRTDD